MPINTAMPVTQQKGHRRLVTITDLILNKPCGFVHNDNSGREPIGALPPVVASEKDLAE